MAKTFNVLEIADEEAITVKLRDGKILRGRDLLPEVVDGLGVIVDKRAREDAKDEVEQRKLMRDLTNDDTADEAYAKASTELTQLTTRAAQRGRSLVYEQLATVFVGDDEKPLSVKVLQEQIPLPVARRIAEELTRQILGRTDGESGNGQGSDGSPTPTGSTSSAQS